MLKKMFFSIIVTGALLAVTVTASAQVDDPKTSQDTLYIYEEEVVYDTLYVYDSTSSSIPKSKEELLQALQKDRGVGKLYHQRGAMYINGAGGELFRLNDMELKGLLSASDYAEYRKAKRNTAISIPLFVAGGCAAAFAGIGLYQFCAVFFQTAKLSDQLLESDRLGPDLWRSAMGGFFIFAGSALATTAFIVPAAILTIKSKVRYNNITHNFNEPTTNLQLGFRAAPCGAAITLSF